ncbi:MarR family transcriptional regulator [Streptomyces sp. SID3343]|uniref:MarR family transcriptional regulator n=1 Tax=Streptomyces sp. SID3343 TaxID=2690260 RepID=UPI00136CB730|nr:MarR family transcriptional regulator [Streptomyces sp. SID3343]
MNAQLWDEVVVLHARVEHELGKALQRRHGIGLSEYRALSRLAVAPDGELRMQELADSIGLNQSSVSRLAVRLEADGLTRRDLCPKDRRGVYSVITDDGRTRLTEATATYEDALDAALAAAASDPQLTALATALGARQAVLAD